MSNPRRREPVSVSLIGLVVTLAAGFVLLAVAYTVPLSVRNGAPFGGEQTIDYQRGIAVPGAEVTPNYDGFDRLGLDLRAYGGPIPGDRYDFIVSVRNIEADQLVRSVAISVDADRIPAGKPPFQDILTDVWFDPIPDSAGVAFYVDVERGPRNVDDVVALWGIQSYSSLTAVDVMEDAIGAYDLGYSARTTSLVLVTLALLSVSGASATVGAIAAAVVAAHRRQHSGSG